MHTCLLAHQLNWQTVVRGVSLISLMIEEYGLDTVQTYMMHVS